MTHRDGPTNTGVDQTIDIDNLSGAYVLNALSDDERRAFEARLGESEDMKKEVTGLSETTVLLAHAATPVMPSAALRASIMDKIATTPQLPALPQTEVAANDTSLTTSTAATRSGRRAATPSESDRDATVLHATGAARARWFTRPVAVLVAAAAAVALFIGGGAVVTAINRTGSSSVNQASGLEEIYAASDFQRTVADVSTGGKATLVWSNQLKRSAVVLDGMTSLPGDKTYELWYINSKGAVPAGTFDTSSDAPMSQVLKGTLTPGDTIGITVEPQGGSEQPTSDPIVALQSA